MPVLRTKIKPKSDAFAANAQRMLEMLAEVQRLEQMVIAESESKRSKFESRGQLLPRERVARLLDRGSPFLEFSRLAGLNMHDDDGKKSVLGGGSIVGIGVVAGKRCLISANDSAVKGGTIAPMGLRKAWRAPTDPIQEQHHIPGQIRRQPDQPRQRAGAQEQCRHNQQPEQQTQPHRLAEHARDLATPWRPPMETVDGDYPVWLTTGRVIYHYLSGTQTRRIGKLINQYPEPLLEIHPGLAASLGIRQRELVRVVTRRGEAEFPAQIVETIREDTVFVPYHWPGRKSANQLTSGHLDPVSKIPEFKVCACRLVPTGKQAPAWEETKAYASP